MEENNPVPVHPLSVHQQSQIRKEVISAVEAEVPQTQKVVDLLNKGGAIAVEVSRVLREGLEAVRPVVADGEIISREVDYDVRRKYAETILDVIGERKIDNSSDGAMVLTVEDRNNLSSRLTIMLGMLNNKRRVVVSNG